jgi:hypothetical protein
MFSPNSWWNRSNDKPAKKAFKAYPIGIFHIDIAEVHTAKGKLFLFVAIDKTIRALGSKFAFAKLAEKANCVTASAFLTALIETVSRQDMPIPPPPICSI